MRRIVIVGGGVAGLSIAHALDKLGAKSQGVDVTVLERGERPGGNIRTEVVDGFTLEWGPNGFLDSVPETLELISDLGIEGRVQVSDDRARRRFIFRRGRLHELPGGPGRFLGSELLSWPAKIRIAFEPFARRRPDDVDETIHAFATRRIGREAADVMIDSMVSGVFGGNARELSLRACFPKMWQMETDHGGLFRALFAKMREKRRSTGPVGAPAGRLTSFKGGCEDLIRGLADKLGSTLRAGAPVARLSRAAQGYAVSLDSGETLDADAVVLAGPTSSSSQIVSKLDDELSSALAEIPSAPIVVVCLAYEESQLPQPLDGFGFLVPRGEGPRILGVLWDSSIYPGRAPEGQVLMRVMIGGAHDPDAIEMDDQTLLKTVKADLVTTMGLDLSPSFTHIFRHRLGIPQYKVGHLDTLRRIDAALARHPGLYVAGNGYRGVAINSCVAEAGPIAKSLLAD